jgi:hypothetical protein
MNMDRTQSSNDVLACHGERSEPSGHRMRPSPVRCPDASASPQHDKEGLAKCNRRDFLVGVVRYGTLGLIGVAGGLVAAKRRRLVRQGLCINDGACAGCAVLAQCGLPAALSLREQER